MMRTIVLAGIVLAALVVPSRSADHPVLGKSLVVRNPTGDESRRKLVVVGRGTAGDLTALSDPTVDGATLQILLSGGTSSERSYDLQANMWRPVGNGYRYVAGIAQPVRMVLLRRASNGAARLKVVLDGGTGFIAMDHVPPNPGDAARVMLDVDGGDRYCAGFGGPAGGTEGVDSASLWKVTQATAVITCPTPALPACAEEFASCGSCGDGICVAHAYGSPPFVCASQSGYSAGTCTSSAECTAPRECLGLPSLVCPGPGLCSLRCHSDTLCEDAFSGFCADVFCRGGRLCLIPCP